VTFTVSMPWHRLDLMRLLPEVWRDHSGPVHPFDHRADEAR